ncbi:MAG: hypothetical protein JSR19_10185 [Proteobacteria bacterium]|nr:hypothetical protein [Pseudomonadota bacterium]HQR03235.1 alkaline phosphatase family protein [Rhodocyclaceae bacterium]
MKLLRKLRHACVFALMGGLFLVPALSRAATWVPDHTVLVILENKSFQDFIGNADAPYLNRLAARGALMTRAYFAETPYAATPTGFKHPLPSRGSQVNYLYLFSGNDQGMRPDWFEQPGSPYKGMVTHDQYGELLPEALSNVPKGLSNGHIPPALRPFATPNLGAAILATGRTYATFSEALPYPAFDGATNNPPGTHDGYARRHNPGINWINLPDHAVPAARRRFLLPLDTNLGFSATTAPDGSKYPGFAENAESKPRSFASLPTLAIVVPTNDDNAHTGSIASADAWLAKHIEPYVRWAQAHNSLLVIQCDEDGFSDTSNGAGATDKVMARMMAKANVGYQYGTDRILTLFVGPRGRVLPGKYDERVDHLNVLATLLDRYGALEAFRKDFFAVHVTGQPDPKLAAEGAREYMNLRPIVDIFGEGGALPTLPGR